MRDGSRRVGPPLRSSQNPRTFPSAPAGEPLQPGTSCGQPGHRGWAELGASDCQEAFLVTYHLFNTDLSDMKLKIVYVLDDVVDLK